MPNGVRDNMKLLKKILFINVIFLLQAGALYLFYINQDLVYNIKFSYIKDVYLPSFLYKVSSRGNIIDNRKAEFVPVLVYHGIIVKSDNANILVDNFRDQMFALKEAGYNAIGANDLQEFLKGEKQLPEKLFVLTFDDGRKDSYYPVDPILKALDYKAVMFVIVGHSIGNEERDSHFYLSEIELRKMIKSGRWDIESHGYKDHGFIEINREGDLGHFLSNKMWLSNKQRLETEDEFKNRISADLEKAKDILERELNIRVNGFAFPYGDYGHLLSNVSGAQNIIMDIAEKHYDMLFAQAWNKNENENRPNNGKMVKRISVKPEWSAQDLLSEIEK